MSEEQSEKLQRQVSRDARNLIDQITQAYGCAIFLNESQNLATAGVDHLIDNGKVLLLWTLLPYPTLQHLGVMIIWNIIFSSVRNTLNWHFRCILQQNLNRVDPLLKLQLMRSRKRARSKIFYGFFNLDLKIYIKNIDNTLRN